MSEQGPDTSETSDQPTIGDVVTQALEDGADPEEVWAVLEQLLGGDIAEENEA